MEDRRGGGGTQGKEAMRTERSGNRNELGLYYSRLDITQEHFLLHEMSALFFFSLSQGLFLIFKLLELICFKKQQQQQQTAGKHRGNICDIMFLNSTEQRPRKKQFICYVF